MRLKTRPPYPQGRCNALPGDPLTRQIRGLPPTFVALLRVSNSILIRTAYRSILLKMIRSFRCKDTQRIWQGQSSRKFPGDIQDRALRKLRQLDAAAILEDLRNPPGNRLEVLRGKRIGQMSTRINDQWRICFRWVDHDAWDVEIVDYH